MWFPHGPDRFLKSRRPPSGLSIPLSLTSTLSLPAGPTEDKVWHWRVDQYGQCPPCPIVLHHLFNYTRSSIQDFIKYVQRDSCGEGCPKGRSEISYAGLVT